MMDIGTVTSVGIHFMTDCCLRKRLIIFIYSRYGDEIWLVAILGCGDMWINTHSEF